MGKSTLNVPFSIAMLNYQRVGIPIMIIIIPTELKVVQLIALKSQAIMVVSMAHVKITTIINNLSKSKSP
jgi:hypothetical protein